MIPNWTAYVYPKASNPHNSSFVIRHFCPQPPNIRCGFQKPIIVARLMLPINHGMNR